MNRRGAGLTFILIAALLFCTRYISAAIFGSNVSIWNAELFAAMLEYTGSELLVISIISLLVGIVYLFWAEKEKS